MKTSSLQKNIKNQSIASSHDNMNDFNSLAPNYEKNIMDEKPSDVLNFSNMSHELVWRNQEEGYDNIMKNSYFSLSEKAIAHSRKNDKNSTPQDMLREMKEVAGARNVPHFLNYPSENSDGTISNLMIKERNFQKYIENPTKVRDMIADAFLLKIANDGSISEMDREELIKEAENGKDSAELHDMMARMAYNKPKAYKAFHKILLDSEMIYKKIKQGDNYGFLSDTYNEFYEETAKKLLSTQDGYYNAEFYKTDNGLYVRSGELEESVTKALKGKDIISVGKLLSDIEELSVQYGLDYDDSDSLEDFIKRINTTVDNAKDVSDAEKIKTKKTFEEYKHYRQKITIQELKKIQDDISSIYEFANQHDSNQKTANEILHEMHQSGRFDQNPYAFLDIPKIGDTKEDGTLFSREEVTQELEYNRSLIRKAVDVITSTSMSEEDKNEITENIVKDLYYAGDKIGNKKGAYYDAIKSFIEKAKNDPMTMTVYSELNSVATTIMRDAIYNELMEKKLGNSKNKIFETLKNSGSNHDKGKAVHISEKLKVGSYEESLSKQAEVKDEVATLMNKATLFSKVAKGEINANQTEAIIDKTAIFRDMDTDEKEAIKDVTNDIFEAKNEIDMSKYYNIDSESRSRFLDDVVTDNVFGYLENVDNVMMPGVSKFFRNNRALSNFGRCGQSGSVKDRNAESVANNLKGCMETYKQEIESGEREGMDAALKNLHTPFGSMNGILVFLIILEQIITDIEYRRTKKALNEMHHDILNKLAFRRASPDLQTEKARAAILSADANRGVTTTTIAHAVADKYINSLKKEKLASSIFKEAMDGRNMFLEKKIFFPKVEEQEQEINSELSLIAKEREQLSAKINLLKDKVKIIKKASLIDAENLSSTAEETYEAFEEINKEISNNPSNKTLLDSKKKILSKLEILKEQREIIEASWRMKSENFDPIEETVALQEKLEKVDKKISSITVKRSFLEAKAETLEDITNDNMSVLIAKSQYLKSTAERIASKKVDNLSNKDRKALENISRSREILAAAMLETGSLEGSLQYLKESILEQFGEASLQERKKSGTQRSIEALGLRNFRVDVYKIIEKIDNGYDEVLYSDLLLKIEDAKGSKKEVLQKEQDKILKETLSGLNAEINKLKNNSDEVSVKQLKARTKEKDRLIDYIQSTFLAREIEKQSKISEQLGEVFLGKLQNANPDEARRIIDENKKLISNQFEQSHALVFEEVKEKLIEIDKELINSNLDKKSDIVHEARSTGYIRKIEELSSTIKNIVSLKSAKVGDTHSSIMLSNRINEIMKKNKEEYNDEILDASTVAVREFQNKSHDNMASMLLFTDDRAVYMESHRNTLQKQNKIFESTELDTHLKSYVANNMSYDVSGIENWGANAKSREDIMYNGNSAQEGQRQTRSAMLR